MEPAQCLKNPHRTKLHNLKNPHGTSTEPHEALQTKLLQNLKKLQQGMSGVNDWSITCVVKIIIIIAGAELSSDRKPTSLVRETRSTRGIRVINNMADERRNIFSDI